MVSDGQRSTQLSSHDVGRLAEAFELTIDRVLEDVQIVAGWHGSEHALTDLLQQRHGWDATVAPFYVSWLRRTGRSR